MTHQIRSAVYEGWVRHRRFEPVAHEFRYRLFLPYLDLGELPGVLDPYPLWSARRPAPAWFRRSDFMGPSERPLDECVRQAAAKELGSEPKGPVRMLANLRYLGHCFNPVSFYFCFDAAGEAVRAVVADVTNTPWGEHHAYAIGHGTDEGRVIGGRLEKAFHVSPLMGMDYAYDWRVTTPGDDLVVHIGSRRGERTAFDATLSLRRHELSPAVMRRALARYPAMTARIAALIYWQALRLRVKGARYFPHPERTSEAGG
ncbi:MAG: uncharacterized protein QOJ01_1100 [Solirubrobacterales bacterium]|nr:uncharacterized protein [Solirubrobacterales bacterium]